MNQPNPSLFIRLPKLPGSKWQENDIIEVIDSLDYGVIEDVSIITNSRGEQNAIVHFDRWFRGAEDVVNDILRGAKFSIPGLYGKSFIVNMYCPSSQQSRSYVKDPRMNRYGREQSMKSKSTQVHTKPQVYTERLPVINTVYVQTIAGKLPIAPGLTFGHAEKPLLQPIVCNNEFVEEGEIAETPYGRLLSRR